MRKLLLLILILNVTPRSHAQVDLKQPFKDCRIDGSTTIYDYNKKSWFITDSEDANKQTLPASTFKIINLLIALETGVIPDENAIVKWVGKTDTSIYGYRPEIYKDMSIKEAFEKSAGWVFIELAKRIGRDKYKRYLKECNYGNQDLSEKGVDFWNLGDLAISPINQVALLKNVYEEKLPFSKRNLGILKKLLITERSPRYIIRAKTGWTRFDGNDIGWWVGYAESKGNVYFFATRIWKNRATVNPGFAQCRKDITKSILRQIKAIP